MRKGIFSMMTIAILLASSALILTGDEVVDEVSGAGTVEQTIWTSETPYVGTDTVDGVEFGDIYSEKDGLESVIVERGGGVYVVHMEDGTWVREKIWETPGQQLTPAIGDLRPDKTGNEILVVGLSSGTEDLDPGDGTATVLYREGGSWIAERAYTDKKLIHGCAIGDLDSNIDGVEAVVTTFNKTALMVWWDEDHWNNSLIYEDDHNVRKAVIADLTDEHEGNEVVCVAKSGNVTLSWGVAGNWTTRSIYKGEPLARVCVGDVDPDPGLEIYAGTDTFKVIGIKWDGTNWINSVIYTDTDKNRGVWTGDVDPAVAGNELYAFFYSTNLVKITGSFAGGWNTETIFQDTARSHEIRVGDIHPDVPGAEIGIVGYSNNLTLVYPSEWTYDLAFIGTDPIDGIAIGEVYTDKEGFETVITSRDGGVYVVYMEDGSWVKEKIWDSPGQQLTPAIGDLMPEKNGNEILVVGLSSGTEDLDPGDGTATVLYREDNEWKTMRAFTDSKLIHGCDIGDLDPNHEGVEAVLTTFNYTAIQIWWDGAEWHSDLMFTDSHNVRKAVIADLIDSHPGNEVVCVSKSGNATLAYGTAGNWTWERIYTGIPLARVAVGNVDPDPGLEIYLGGDVATGSVIGLKWDGDEWIDLVVFEDTAKNRGVWTGDVDPDVPGQELYAFGYSRKLTQIVDPFGTGKSSKEIFMDAARGHEIRVGDLNPETEGNEIGVVGYSSVLSVVYLKEEGEEVLPVFTGDDSISLSSGEEKAASFTIDGDSYMTLEVSGLDGVDVNIHPESVFIKGDAKVTLKADHVKEDLTGDVTVTLTYPGGTLTKIVTVSVTGDSTIPAATGSSVEEGGKILWNETIEVEFSEKISGGSFQAALSAGLIVLKVDDEAQDVDFELSSDGMMISVRMAEDVARGDATISISGIQDLAGNEMDPYDLGIEIEEEGSGDDGSSLWLIILIILVLAVVLVVLIAGVAKGKNKDENVDEQELPRE